ncbi:unnamed protein product [Brassica oleracea]
MVKGEEACWRLMLIPVGFKSLVTGSINHLLPKAEPSSWPQYCF